MNPTTIPIYKHDCPECRFLAIAFGPETKDWYVHGKTSSDHCSIIARASSVGSDYSSWPADSIYSHRLAQDMAGRVGFVTDFILAQHMLNVAIQTEEL